MRAADAQRRARMNPSPERRSRANAWLAVLPIAESSAPASLTPLRSFLADGDELDGEYVVEERLCAEAVSVAAATQAVAVRFDAARGMLHVAAATASPDLAGTEFALEASGALISESLASGRLRESVQPDDFPFPVRRALTGNAVACLPLTWRGEPFGALLVAHQGSALSPAESVTLGLLVEAAAFGRAVERAAVRRRDRSWSRRLLAFARTLHDGPVQKLFGLSLVLENGHELSSDDCERARNECRAAVRALRGMIGRFSDDAAIRPVGLAERLEGLRRTRRPVAMRVEGGEVQVPAELEPVVEHFVAEATRNALKHSQPREVLVRIVRAERSLTVEVENDGAASARSTPGVGVQLLAAEAREWNGVVSCGGIGDGRWRARLEIERGG